MFFLLLSTCPPVPRVYRQLRVQIPLFDLPFRYLGLEPGTLTSAWTPNVNNVHFFEGLKGTKRAYIKNKVNSQLMLGKGQG